MKYLPLLVLCPAWLAYGSSVQAHDHAAAKLFAQDNLVAWCIVPFDAKRRGPEERAAMLAKLGFKRFAYDYRAEHVPTFAAEIAALKKHDIELTAWWFPSTLNAEARHILDVLAEHKQQPQLWVTGGGGPTKTDDERRQRIASEAARIRPIAEAAAKIGSTVALYNHGGWFGDPENQLAIIEELKLPNVGIVYNQHHGHDQLDRFPHLLQKMLPHLVCLNLNGMTADGERQGRKILPLGQGELDLGLLKTIAASGYRGPIGILGHTQDDAEQRLQDNLDGLAWLVPQLNGKPAGERPQPRTPFPPAKRPADNHHGHAAPPAADAPAALAAEFDPAAVATLLATANQQGDARRGLAVLGSAKFACLSCHQVGTHGGLVGPALTDVGKRLKPEEIAEALLWPKRQVKPEFVAWRFRLADGRTVQGYKRSETAAEIVLFDPASQRTESLAKADIDDAREAGTLMPDGLDAAMTAAQRRDLVRLLLELGRTAGLENEVAPADAPAQFAFAPEPINAENSPLARHPVNRDRVYDFYLKEALHFRSQPRRPHLLPAFPGLDGGKLGHWGNQNDEVWKDDRWNQTDLGTLMAGVFHGPAGVVPKGVCVRLGEKGELAACFNPETLTYDAVWKGGFLKFSAVRHGFLDGLRPIGELQPRPAGQKATQPFVYRGFYRFGPRVVFAYRLGDVEMLDSPWVRDGEFERIVAPASEHPWRAALSGGPAQWPHELATGGELGPQRPYTVDTIKLPFENPWKSLLFCGDHDFLPDGSALVATMTGDVWRVTGLDDKLTDVRWRRFAAGLHQPLGLVIAEGKIYVLGRDQITRLADLNHDGEADLYECFSNRQLTSPAGHDFICGLARDEQGRFYTASGKQGLIRIAADGRQVEVLATGFRNPDGLALLPDGCVTVPCSEGDWTCASMICQVKPGAAAGVVPHFGFGGPRDGQPPSLPLVFLPRGLDNSSGGQAVASDARFGPLAGQTLHFSFGTGSHFLLLRDEVAGLAQGTIVPLPGEFRSGAHRGKVNPRDGQLYVSGMAGWGSYTPDDGCFQRVRYTGAAVQLPKSLHVHENGLLISFVEPIDKSAVSNLAKHFAQAWNYRYGPGYGSPELAPSHPGIVGHEALDIAAVHCLDERTLFVELPDLQPVNQLHLVLQVDRGQPQELFVTVHRLDQPFTGFPGYEPHPKTIAAHPQAVDLALLGKTIPNPWRKRGRPVPTATLEIAAGKNLTYSTRTLRAKAGEGIQLTFTNPDVVPHNWVLVRSDSLAQVGDLANKLVADPEAVLRQYVPRSDDVLVYTDIAAPQQSQTIYFQAPAAKGRYPYLCTFPGHWMVMNGELLVE
ncbi:MAG: TIM barrel protein [Pirellulaceae bacterium]|nr:TIM barrel protein [Pirellulaceae bacterium]